MKKIVLLFSFIYFSIFASGQYFDQKLTKTAAFDHFLQQVESNPAIGADSALYLLSHWNNYPQISSTAREYVYFFEDSFYGNVPLRIFIPASYKNDHKNSLILSLHGAVNISNFGRVSLTIRNEAPKNESDVDPFFDYLSKQNSIIVRPYADPEIKFDWVVNRFAKGVTNPDSVITNLTFATLNKIINQLKSFLNIDDSKVFAIGHSDGSDGAFALEVYTPSAFAGFACYNSMLTNIFASNIYLRNMLNRPCYIIHSDLDDLRPIEQARVIIHELKTFNSPISYKEYIGYKHFDKHLEKDIPDGLKFFNKTTRDPYHPDIYWETNDPAYAQIDWIRITRFDLHKDPAVWQKGINVKSYNKIKKQFEEYDYYRNAESCAIKGSYKNNVFELKTSRVNGFEILIGQQMIDWNLPVQVIVNGKKVFDKKVEKDKTMLIKNFRENRDRQALWISRIDVSL